MSTVSICCFMTVLLCVIQLSNSVPLEVKNYIKVRIEAVDSFRELRYISDSEPRENDRVVTFTTTGKPERTVNADQTTLLFLLDATQLTPYNWELIRNNTIRKLVNTFANRPSDPIFDYIFVRMEGDGKFEESVELSSKL